MTDKERYFAEKYAELFRTRERLIWLLISSAVFLGIIVCTLIRRINTGFLVVPQGALLLSLVMAAVEAFTYNFQKKRIESEEKEWVTSERQTTSNQDF